MVSTETDRYKGLGRGRVGIDGGLIRAARRARGWSQARLIAALRERAEIDHIPLMSATSLRIALSRWENNHHQPDDVHTELLCRVLDLTPSPASASPAIPAPADPPDDSLYGVLAHHTNSLRLLDRRLGAPVVRQQTASHVASLEQLWHNRTKVDRLSVARAQADAASLVAWQDLNLGDLMFPRFRRVEMLDFRPRVGRTVVSFCTRSGFACRGLSGGGAGCGRSRGTRISRSPARSGFSSVSG